MNRILLFVMSVLLVFSSACNKSLPDHARYIPKDAMAVAGINTKELGKKIAWSTLTGNKLLDNIKKQMPYDAALKDLGDAGIKGFSTSYIYFKADKRFEEGKRITAILPLGDAAKWEAYLKKLAPKATIKEQNGRKEADLGNGLYAGWTSDVLIVINGLKKIEVEIQTPMVQDTAAKEVVPNANTSDLSMLNEEDKDVIKDTVAKAPVNAQASVSATPEDVAALAVEMNDAFSVTKENSIVGNERFTKLETSGYDVTFWVNYETLMGAVDLSGMTKGISLSNTLWKDAAMAAGINFEKGKIAGNMLYYVSNDLKEASIELGKTNIDNEMLAKLPAQNLNALLAMHLSPAGLKMILEKMGMLGFVNIAIMDQKDMTVDTIFDAITGDMVVSVNNFGLVKSAYENSENYNPKGDILFALKINNHDHFNKLVQLAMDNGLLIKGQGDNYTIPGNDSIAFVINDKYLVVSNKSASVGGFLQGSGNNSIAVNTVKSHPYGLYVDISSIMGSIDPAISHVPKDSTAIAESKKLFKDLSFMGGTFKNDVFEYKMELNFINSDENSLLQLLDFGIKMSTDSNKTIIAHN
jgi:hypothetical protein